MKMFSLWPMVALAWLLTYLVHSTVLHVMTQLLERVVPRRFERTLEQLWRVALFGPLLTATVQTSGWAPGTIPFELAANAAGPLPTVALRVAARSLELTLGGLLTQRTLIVALAAYLIVALILITRLMGAQRALRRHTGDRVATTDQALVTCAGRAARGRAVRVTVSGRIAGPMALGGTEVCLPMRALSELSADELEAVIVHEVAHLARRDNLWLWATLLIERLFWVQPLNRIAARRLHILAEFGCDDAALGERLSPIALASALARVTSWVTRTASAPMTVAMASKASLSVLRVERMLDDGRAQPLKPTPWATLLCALLLLGVTTSEVPGVVASSHRQYSIFAHDAAGVFALTFKHGTLASVSINGASVNRARIERVANRVVVHGATTASSLDVIMTPSGGISWPPRAAATTEPR